MDDYSKYLKYKKKYLDLRKMMDERRQRGGASKISQIFPLEDQIHFWGRQMMEHALIAHLGLNDGVVPPKVPIDVDPAPKPNVDAYGNNSTFKNLALQSYLKWRKFMNNTFYKNGIKVTLQTITIADQLRDNNIKVDIDQLRRLIEETIQFKTTLLRQLEAGGWYGWVFPAMVDHMLGEALYFQRIVNNNPMPLQEEIQYIIIHHRTELAATAQLIDPVEAQQPVIDAVRSYVLLNMSGFKAGKSLTGTLGNDLPFPTNQWNAATETQLKSIITNPDANILAIAIQFSEEVTQLADLTGQQIDAGTLKTVIHPLLAHHVHRELAWFTNKLQLLQASQQQ